MFLVVVDSLVGEIHGSIQGEVVCQNSFFVHQVFPENMNPLRVQTAQIIDPGKEVTVLRIMAGDYDYLGASLQQFPEHLGKAYRRGRPTGYDSAELARPVVDQIDVGDPR